MNDDLTSEDTLVLSSPAMVEIDLSDTTTNVTPPADATADPALSLFSQLPSEITGVYPSFFDAALASAPLGGCVFQLSHNRAATTQYTSWLVERLYDGSVTPTDARLTQYVDALVDLVLHNAALPDVLKALYDNALSGPMREAVECVMREHDLYLPYIVLRDFNGHLPSFSLGTIRDLYYATPGDNFLHHFRDESAFREYMRTTLSLGECNHCEEVEMGRHFRSTYDGGHDVCRHCIENSFTFVDRYGDYVYSENVRNRAIDEDGLRVTISCDDSDFHYDDWRECYVHDDYENDDDDEDSDDDDDSGVIAGYHSSKGRIEFQHDPWTASNKRFIGVELEVEVKTGDRRESAARIHDEVNSSRPGTPLFFEDDGSLRHGFEMITQPMSLPAQRKLWSLLNNPDLVRGLRSHDTETCGLHVHVSKAGMSSLQIAKVVTFVNDEKNAALIHAIARRRSTSYCQIIKKKIGSAHYSSNRYEAVNLLPRHTIEFRIFKGSLKYEAVIAAIEFANAVVAFCRTAETSVQDLTTPKFMEFITTKLPKETSILRPYLSNRLDGE